MSGIFYDITRMVGKVAEEVVTAPEQIMTAVDDALEEFLDGK